MGNLKWVFNIIGLSTLLACGNNSQKNLKNDSTTISRPVDINQLTITRKDTAANDIPAMLLSIDNFKKIPADIDGCGCYFSSSEEKFMQKEYLFVANYDSVAFISVEKKPVKLKLLSTTRDPGTFGDYDHIDTYNSDKYKVILDIKYKNSGGDETWQNDGTITIEDEEGRKAVRKFFGECGC